MIINVTRNPFRIDQITPLMRRYRFVSEVKKWFPGIGKKWIRLQVENTARQKHTLGQALNVTVKTNKGFPDIQFEATEINSQLSAIYFDRYKMIYEPDIECCLEIMVPQATSFIDVGANWGYFVAKVACMRSDVELIAFEPASLSFADLRSLCEGFSTHATINAFQLALGDVKGKSTITQLGFESGLASIIPEKNKLNYSFSTEEIEISTLDELEIQTNSIIKIDVEGFELKVMQGGKEQISRAKPAIIFEHWQLSQTDLDPFLRFFNQLGYVLYRPFAAVVGTRTQQSNGHVPVDFRVNIIDQLKCDRRYNLIAIHPLTHFHKMIVPYLHTTQRT